MRHGCSALPDQERHRVASVDRFEDGDRVIAEIAGQEIAVFRLDGEFYALANFCAHQGGPLCEGPTTGTTEYDPDGWAWTADEADRVVRCPWHGWRFDITTGESLQSDRYRTPTYDVEIADGEVFVRR